MSFPFANWLDWLSLHTSNTQTHKRKTQLMRTECLGEDLRAQKYHKTSMGGWVPRWVQGVGVNLEGILGRGH